MHFDEAFKVDFAVVLHAEPKITHDARLKVSSFIVSHMQIFVKLMVGSLTASSLILSNNELQDSVRKIPPCLSECQGINFSQ